MLEWEKYFFFMDTSTLDEKQKEYVNLAREEVFVQKRAMVAVAWVAWVAVALAAWEA